MKSLLGGLGFLLTLGTGLAAFLAHRMATGVPSLDRPGIRLRAALYGPIIVGPRWVLDPTISRGWMAIIHNESLGDPANYLGDETLPGGPSIGPGQVYRATAIKAGLVPADETPADYAAMAQDEDQGVRWSLKVYAAKLDEQGGNVPAAVRAYNGRGPQADAYLVRAGDFFASTYGGLLS